MTNEFWIITSAFIAGGIIAIVCDRLGYRRGVRDTLARQARAFKNQTASKYGGTHP